MINCKEFCRTVFWRGNAFASWGVA